MTSSLTYLFLLLVACTIGCNDSSTRTRAGSDGGGGGECTDVSGSWTITEHCNTALVGMPVTVTQTGCSFTIGAPFDGFAGTTGSGGAISVTGSVEEMVITCTGTASTGSIDLTCTEDCAVRMTR